MAAEEQPGCCNGNYACSYLTPTSQLAPQRLLFYGIRLCIEFITTFPVAYLVYQSRIFVAAGDSVGIARDSVGVAIAIVNMIVQVSGEPVDFTAINAGTGPGGLFASFPTNGSRGCYTGPGPLPSCVPPPSPPPPRVQGKQMMDVTDVNSGVTGSLSKPSNPLWQLAAQLAVGGITSREQRPHERGQRPEERPVWHRWQRGGAAAAESHPQGLLPEQPGQLQLPPGGSACRQLRHQGHQYVAQHKCPGVIDLPAVPQLGLPAVPFPTGFPSPLPALNEDVLRVSRTTAGALAVFATILNLISTTLLAVGDIIAVIIVSTTLVTGPILFQLASVDYYNTLVAAFPDMPNGDLTIFTKALGAIGSGLTTPGNVFLGSGSGTGGSSSLWSALTSLRGAATQLRDLRTQLLPSSTRPRASVST